MIQGQSDKDYRDCPCADPENCRAPIPGYRCRRGEVRSQSNTPRTDAVNPNPTTIDAHSYNRMWEHSCQLERELAKAHSERIANSAALHDMTKRAEAAERDLKATPSATAETLPMGLIDRGLAALAEWGHAHNEASEKRARDALFAFKDELLALRATPPEAVDKLDAERYRWWTKNYGTEWDGDGRTKLYTLIGPHNVDTKEAFDAAIDAAIKRTGPHNGEGKT